MIVVAGEALIDLVDDDGVPRPVPGGGPFNTAIALGRLGIPVAYLGTLSRDDHGSLLARGLIEAGVDPSLIRWRQSAVTPKIIASYGLGDAVLTVMEVVRQGGDAAIAGQQCPA